MRIILIYPRYIVADILKAIPVMEYFKRYCFETIFEDILIQSDHLLDGLPSVPFFGNWGPGSCSTPLPNGGGYTAWRGDKFGGGPVRVSVFTESRILIPVHDVLRVVHEEVVFKEVVPKEVVLVTLLLLTSTNT